MEIGKHSRKLIEIRKAIRHATLTSEGLLPIEGAILLEEAQRSGVDVVDVFRRKGTDLPAMQTASIFEVDPNVFKTIQDTEHSQGVIATVRPPQYGLEDVLRDSPQLLLVLSRLQDPGNVGTILRIAEAFGSTGCIALHGTAGFHNSKVVRASAGSLFRFPHIGPRTLAETVTALQSRNIGLVGTSPKAHQTIQEWNWSNPTAILVGNEGQGLSSEELNQCNAVLRIPHKGTVDSLNSAIATAVVLYEASMQRR